MKIEDFKMAEKLVYQIDQLTDAQTVLLFHPFAITIVTKADIDDCKIVPSKRLWYAINKAIALEMTLLRDELKAI